MKIFKSTDMKTTFTTLLMLLLMLTSAMAQSDSDRIEVLGQLLNHPDLIDQMAVNSDGSVKQRYILQYPASFSADVIASLPISVAIILEDAELPSNASNWIRFRSFGISSTVTSGVLTLFVDLNGNGEPVVKMVHFELQKSGSNWQVTNLNIGG